MLTHPPLWRVFYGDWHISHPPLYSNAPLQHLNTFGLPARAAWLARIETLEQLAELRTRPAWHCQPRRVLGAGSNVVLSGDIAGLVLQVQIRGRRLVAEDAQAWYVQAGAGENWHELVRWSLDCGWPGLENLAGIPGTMGAAPVQNIGAYGLELADRFHTLQALDLHSGELLTWERDACQFAYRDSVFKRSASRYLISSVTLRLPKRWQAQLAYSELAQALASCAEPSPLDIAQAVLTLRSRKLPDPQHLGNAGSFFKNPLLEAAHFARLMQRYPQIAHYPQADGRVKVAAGWLIERCGWKGKRSGTVGVYAQQALVLVNHGGASGREVVQLATAIQATVQDKFEIVLEIEPVIW